MPFTDQIQATAEAVRGARERAEKAVEATKTALSAIDGQEKQLLADAEIAHDEKKREIASLMQMLRDHVKTAAQGHELTVEELS